MNQAALIENHIPIPAAIPWSVRQALAGRRVAFDLPRALKLRMRHPEKMRVSEWAEKHRVVTDGAHEGPWRHEYAPHTVKIMDTFGLPWVREVWFCGVEQSGKTNTMLNCIGWAVDCDPGNIFYLMPTEDTAAKITGGKLRPTLQKSPRLARYLTGRQDDVTLSRINLQHGVNIFPAHANSASSMATWAAKHCFGDEIDKYPAMAGKEADPITLIKKRNRTYKGRYKRFFASTPAGMYIYKGMQNCHQVWEYRLKCPHCGELVRMDAEHLILPPASDGTTPTPEDAERLGAAYECNACGELWDDTDREAAIRSGRWHCVKGADVHRPAKVGFHHRAWECLDITLSEIAAAWLRAQQGDLAAKVAWANGYEAVDYVEEIGEAPELAGLMDRAEPYAPIVPMNAGILTAGVDVQMDRLEIEVVAWGIGAESWGIDYAVLYGDTRLPEVWEQLDGYLLQTWEHATGEQLRLARVFIDSGYIPNQVAKFCAPRRARGVYAIKGASTEKAPEIQGPNRQRHGSVTCEVYNLGVNRLKTQMFAYFGLNQPGPGYCHLPDTYPANWYDMLQAEHVVEKKVGNETCNVWVKKSTNSRNESIDLRVYAMAAMMSIKGLNIKAQIAALKAAAAEKAAPKSIPPRKPGFATRWK